VPALPPSRRYHCYNITFTTNGNAATTATNAAKTEIATIVTMATIALLVLLLPLTITAAIATIAVIDNDAMLSFKTMANIILIAAIQARIRVGLLGAPPCHRSIVVRLLQPAHQSTVNCCRSQILMNDVAMEGS
jgi:hypothetical protein